MKLNKKSLVLLVCVAMLLTITVSGTVAFLADDSGPVINEFTPVNVPPTVNESFTGTVKSNVKIGNTGNIDAYIRAMVIITWQDEDGNVLSTLPVATGDSADYAITWGLSGWDRVTTDGCYYHTAPVAPNGETSVLITECKPLKAAPVEGYTLHVEILAQAIQAEPIDAVKAAWGVSATEATDSNGNTYYAISK